MGETLTDTDTDIFHFDSYTNKSARRHKDEGMIKKKCMYSNIQYTKRAKLQKVKMRVKKQNASNKRKFDMSQG